MKKLKLTNLATSAHKLWLIIAVLGVSTSAFSTSKEYLASEASTLVSDIEAGTYDEYVLSESAGIYDLSDIDISISAIIKGKDGLETKPTIINNGDNSSAYNAFLDLAVGDLSITLQGIIFDGAAAPTPMMGVVRIDKTNCEIIMKDCEVKNFSTNSGFVRIDAAGAAFSIEDSYVHDCYGRLIRVGNTGDAFGDISIENSTFANITDDPVIQWVSSASSTVNSISISQSTFYNVADYAFKLGEVINGVTITNCNFDAITSNINTLATNSITIDYSYGGFGAALGEGIVVTNAITTVPQYANASILDLQLLNEKDLLGSDALTPIGDSRWTSTAESTVLEVLYGEQILTDDAGQEALLKSTIGSGFVYIILEGEAQSTLTEMDAAVAVNKGAKGIVTSAFEDISLSVENLTTGNYYGYAVYDADSISEKGSNTISVYPSLNIQYEEQTAPNSSGSTVELTSSKDGFIYIAIEGDYPNIEALEAAINGGRAAKSACTANTPTTIDITGIRAGTYVGFAVNANNVISEPGNNPIYITTSVYVEYENQTASNKDGQWAFAYVSAGTGGGIAYLLNDAISADATVTLEMLNNAIATNDADSLSIPTEMTNYKVPTVNKNAGSYHFYLVKDGQISEQGPNVITVRTPSTYFFREDQVEEMRLALYNQHITTGDEVVLTTSGGHYGFKTYFRIYGGITFRAKEGLAEKPVFCYDPDAHGETHRSYMRLMEFYPPAGAIYIQGIEFDGGAADENINNDATCAFEARYNATFNYPYSLVYDDCVFHDFNTINTSSAGTVAQDGYIFRQRANIYADSIVFNNCAISHTYLDAFMFISGDNYNYFGQFIVKNTTINGVDAVLDITKPDMSHSLISMDYCTMDNLGNDDATSRFILPEGIENMIINNSIITNACSATPTDSALVLGSSSSVMNTAFFNVPLIIDGTQTDVTTDKDPNYYSPSLFNYAVKNSDLLTASSKGAQIGDQRWSATNNFKVNEIMLTASDTTLILYFNQAFDTTEAVTATNYTLSGTYGVIGNPIKVEMFDHNAVKIYLDNFSNGQDFETIVITVDNVTNVNDNTLVTSNNKGTYTFPILAKMVAQTVGNEDGQYILSTCGSTNGYVYIISETETENINTPADLDQLVEAGVGAKAKVDNAGEFAQIPVQGLAPGIYYGYAINAEGDIMSIKSAEASTIKGLEASMGLQFSITNGEGQTVKAQSTYTNATLYLALDDTNLVIIETVQDLLTAVDNKYAVSSEVTTAFQDVNISVSGIYATASGARYKAYVVSGDSLSAPSSGAVIVMEAPNAIKMVNDDSKVLIYSNNGMVNIKSTDANPATIKVYNLKGSLEKSLNTESAFTSFNLPRGLYIIQVQKKNSTYQRKIVN